MNWNIFKTIINGKTVTSTSLWVFVVPILLKITEGFNALVPIQSITQLTLPSNFYVLYLSGLAFFIGGIIFLLFCPRIVQDFDTYAEFEKGGHNAISLQSYTENFAEIEAKELVKLLTDNVEKPTTEEIDSDNVCAISVGGAKNIFIFRRDKMGDTFWTVYSFSQNYRATLFFVTLAFHVLGLLGLSWVFISNFVLVLHSVI